MDKWLPVLLVCMGIVIWIILRMQKRNRDMKRQLKLLQTNLNDVQKEADRHLDKLQQAQKIMNKLHIFKNQLTEFFVELEDHPENAKAATKGARLNFRSFLSFFEKSAPEINPNDQTDEIISHIKRDFPLLNAKEIWVVTYVLQGYTSKEIAQLISKSVKNVEQTRTEIRRKMQISDGKTLLEFLENR